MLDVVDPNAAAASSTLKVTRMYGNGAVRVDGDLSWQINDHQGSPHVTIDDGAAISTAQPRRQLPYGEERTTPTTPLTDREFLDAPTTAGTNIVHLGARQYDPHLRHFLSVDPMGASAEEMVNAYQYGNLNPASNSDPSGLCVVNGPGGACLEDLQIGFDGEPLDETGADYWNHVAVSESKRLGCYGTGSCSDSHSEFITWTALGRPSAYDWGYGPSFSQSAAGAIDWTRRAFLFDESPCLAGSGWCALEVAGILPFGKLGKVGKILGFTDEAAQARRLSAGLLEDLGGGAYRSSRGLIFRNWDPSSKFANRLEHLLSHGSDIPARPRHGVFAIDPVAAADAAWGAAQRGHAFRVVDGQRTVYYANMGYTIGHAGGKAGKASGHMPLQYIRLVVENGNQIVTAYPVSGIPLG